LTKSLSIIVKMLVIESLKIQLLIPVICDFRVPPNLFVNQGF
jgi:hypothetical protein